MIGAAFTPSPPPRWFTPDRIASSLGLFAGEKAATHRTNGGHFWQLAAPRLSPRDRTIQDARAWKPHRAQGGIAALLDGTIDNAEELGKALSLPVDSRAEALYCAAVQRWGGDADRHVIGQYTSIVSLPDGTLRLSRSPWNGPSLFWMARDGVRMAASIPRPFFAAGFPKHLKPNQLAESLYWIENHEGGYWYTGLNYIGHGTVVTLGPDGTASTHRWYDPHDIPRIRLASDEAYVEQANALLEDAVRAALKPARKPGIMLSGGLDSAIVADEILRQLPDDRALHSFTFVSRADYSDTPAPGVFVDDRRLVEEFAQSHARLTPHFSDNAEYDFDGLYDKFLLASDIGRPSFAISTAYHGPAMAAASQGCDWLFHAGMGNSSFSQDGRWAYVEFTRSGNWGELWRMARDHPGDWRPMWRRIVARSALPQLPAGLRHLARRMMHGPSEPLNAQISLIRPEAREQGQLDRLAQETGDRRNGEWFRSRREWLDFIWRSHDAGAEQHYATTQVYGLNMRDVTAYRPLIEFCAGLPTDQFVRDGVQRFLARRMAKGRMPQAQAGNTDYGQHNADWHLRMTDRLPELRAEMERITDDPDLAQIIDSSAALALLENWPTETPRDPIVVKRHFHALTGAMLAARFWRFIKGSNY